MCTSFLHWKNLLLICVHVSGEVCRRLTSKVFIFSEPCIVMHIREKELQDGHFFLILYFTFVPCSILILSKFYLFTN